jgi:UDP-N-acetylglucosamine 2-epimerase (non-hydrolysing)
MKFKVLTILGTRPEIIRLSSIIKKLDIFFNHKLVNTSQNFDNNLNKIFFKDLEVKKPNYNLNCKGDTPSKFLSQLFIKVEKVLDFEKPDAVIILGDTNSALSAICVKRKKIPIFHIEAGNRCFDERIPEEINRKIVDHIADINLTYSSYASENLVREGLHKDRIIKIGSPLYEVYNDNYYKIEQSKILKKLNIENKKFIIASIHREENLNNLDGLKSILDSLLILKKRLKLKIIFSTHPRTKKIIKDIKGIYKKDINFCNPFGYSDFMCLMKNSTLVMSDSGSITEETSILSIPSVNLRFANERQEGMEYGTIIMSGHNTENILNAADIALKENKNGDKKFLLTDYSRPNVSQAVINIIQSYIPYIKDKVWHIR